MGKAFVPWREGPPLCTNCGDLAKPHPAYADFVGPFCEGCWERLREYFTSGVICLVCKARTRQRDVRLPSESLVMARCLCSLLHRWKIYRSIPKDQRDILDDWLLLTGWE